ncbi:hypothetical protein A4G99_01010 [Haladaptatus sp. R4]|uniref:hypothetical protein n=1 Tax=Haladaptatus sp. R4 TaxID=1679489 RepID=UPI0007B4B224|nr:hypothetical protein [Haladaptatus sp. R4]KZN25140.1 hypothetical protein A4G99_01010 [Haladaptatus sp. R4]
MDEVSIPPNANEIEAAVDEAVHGLELDPHEAARIFGFINEELPYLQTPETTYFVLGSYWEPYIRRLRIVENELNKRIGAYAFVMGDVREIGLDRLPEFRIRFHLLATYADALVGVYEQDAGGEMTELGKISETPYFEKSHALPRDYSWMSGERIADERDVVAAGVAIYENDELSDDETGRELTSLLETAHKNGIEVEREELEHTIQKRLEDGTDPANYSWVHINEFRLFELHDRCYPWIDEGDLRDCVKNVPK